MTMRSGSARRESAQRRFGEDADAEMERKLQRIASLDVMGLSALDG
jgi:ADP-ribosylation factor related protein 1